MHGQGILGSMIERRASGTTVAGSHADTVTTITVGRDDHRAFTGESGIADLARLVRFRDGAYEAVEAGSLSDCERVYVFVHGWVPGSRDVADLLYAQEGDVVTAWDERVRNVAGQTMVETYQPLLAALHGRDPEAAVLWFSWVDQSATDTTLLAARGSLRNAPVNGCRLALALADAIGDGEAAIHLIGHSHGCVVSTHAALSMPTPPVHLTLLDCPEDWFSRAGGAAGLLTGPLARLQPGRGPGRVFVDAYASMFGRAYHDEAGLGDVVDVRLTPMLKSTDDADTTRVSRAHQYPVQWYADSVTDPDAVGGFAWSALQGFDTTELAASYVNPSRQRLVALGRRRSGAEPQVVVAPLVIDTIPIPVQRLTAREPDVLMAWRIDPDAMAVEFDYDLIRPGRRTRLEAAVNRQVVFVASGRAKVPARGRLLSLPVSTDPDVVVQFRLLHGGLRTAATVTGLRIVRTPRRAVRNYDDARLVAAVAGLGAVVGAAAALLLVGAAALSRRSLRAE